MLYRTVTFFFVLLLLVSDCYAREIGGIDLAEGLEISGSNLVLNGAGIRKKLFIKLYVGGLYLKATSNIAPEIIQADQPMAIRLHMISSMITSEKMATSTREGFHKATGGNIVPLKARIEKFIAVFLREEIKKNDIYDLKYLPGRGVEVYKNGTSHALVAGLDFKQALFGIWLGEQPAQQSLKAGMLGSGS